MISVKILNPRLNPRTFFAFAVLLICSLPGGLNLLGLDFGLHMPELRPATPVDGGHLLHAVAGVILHALLEWSAVCIATLTALAAFLHYIVRRDLTVPVIGLALLSAGLVDAFHTLAATHLIEIETSTGNTDFIPFTWAISRIFHAGIMIAGVTVGFWIVRRPPGGDLRHHSGTLLAVISLLFVGVAYAVVHAAVASPSLPQTIYRGAFITRPFDVLPLVLFGLGGALFWAWYKQDPTPARYALVLSTIPGVITQLHMVFGSETLFDNHFIVSHFLKNILYGTVFIGILVDLLGQIEEKSRQQIDAADRAEEVSARIQAILNSAAEAIITLDSKGKILSFNKTAVRIFGYTEQEVQRRSIDLLLPARYREKYGNTLSGFIRTGEAVMGEEIELYGVRKSGDEFPVAISLSEVAVPDGRIYTGFIRDISEQKRLEKERKAALEQAQASARMKSEFLACMSHEIRTPMNGVLGMLSLLLRGELSEKQSQYAGLARSSAESLLSLLNDILDFSKIEAGKLELEILDFNLRNQLEECTKAMAFRAQTKGLELVLDVTQLPPIMVRGDSGRLRQILTNLVDNAVKFTAAGEIVVRAALVAEAETSGARDPMLRCSVADTGIGIAAAKTDGLFDSFTQVDASTTRKFGGSGLGLAVVHQLCGLMGGGIEVTSEEGRGSCFEFTVQLQPSEKPPGVQPRFDLRGSRILVVDNNATNREVLCRQLRLWRAQAVAVDAGPAALQALDRNFAQTPFSVALVDMQMPGMGGKALGKKIRADKRFDPTRLIMMTSVGEKGDARFFTDLGFSAYLPKPAISAELFAALTAASSPCNPQQVLRQRVHRQEARILLVEDNAINQEVALGLLDELGFDAGVAGNGIEAIATLGGALGNGSFQLILMDCQMPDMDGYETTRKIRAGACGESNCDIPIIAMTANAMKGDRDKCLAAGMNDYLAKPIDVDELENRLDHWLKPDRPVPMDVHQRRRADVPFAVPVWDRAAVLKRVAGKESRLLHLVGSFLREMPEAVGRLQQMVQQYRIDEVAKIAHTINGVAGNLSGMRVKSIVADIETAARASDLTAVKRLWPVFAEQFQLLRECLEKECRQMSAAGPEPAAVKGPPLSALLQSIAAKLRRGQYIAPSEIDALTLRLPGQREAVSQLVAEITRRDFENALDSVAALAASREVTGTE